MIKSLIITSLVLGFNAMAAETPPAAAPAAAAEASPTTACRALIDSAQKKDFAEFNKWTIGGGKMARKGTKARFAKMNEKYLEKLQGLTCLNESVAEDHAFVEAEAQGVKRFVPFIKTETGWKFDAMTYRAFYHHPGRGKKM